MLHKNVIKETSPVHSAFDANDVRPFHVDKDYAMDELEALLPLIGVGFNPGQLENLMNQYGYAMDTIQNPLTTPSVVAPVQFLQEWLPGYIAVVTAARQIDNIVGISTVGSWEDEQVILQQLETTGSPAPYNDLNVVPLTDWNLNFVNRTVVRFEQGFKVGPLEQARSARIRIASDAVKRASAGLQLEIQRNAVGFYGYNSGANLTYGFVNDPNLPNWVTVATVGGHTTWVDKTPTEIQGDILTALQALRTQSQGVIDPSKDAITMVVATNRVDYLSKATDFMISTKDWMAKNYPNVRVVDCIQYNGVNGGANGFSVHADSVNDGLSTDDLKTFIQVVPARTQLIGTQQLSKGYEEDLSNATAGTICKRPFAVKRYSGI